MDGFSICNTFVSKINETSFIEEQNNDHKFNELVVTQENKFNETIVTQEINNYETIGTEEINNYENNETIGAEEINNYENNETIGTEEINNYDFNFKDFKIPERGTGFLSDNEKNVLSFDNNTKKWLWIDCKKN